MISKTTALVLALGSISITACSSGSGNNAGLISASEQKTRVFADTNGDGVGDQDFGVVLNDNTKSLVAREVSESSWLEEFGKGYSPLDGSLSIKGEGDDLLVTIPDGQGSTTTVRIVNARAITTNSVRIDTRSTGGYIFDMFLGKNKSIGELLTPGTGYSVPIGIFYTKGGASKGFETRSIIGTETTDARIDALRNSSAIATYNGFGSINIRKVDQDWQAFNSHVQGDVAMTADFGAGSVSGTMTNLFYEERAGNTVTASSNPNGSVIMNPATIQANAFKGALSPDSTLLADSPDLANTAGQLGYSGAFYGPQAQEISGTMSGSATVNGQDYLAMGRFDGN